MVEHIVRLTAYLSTSRHGIFYFRFPVPPDRHPARKRTHIKVSLGTREPRRAGQLARFLTLAGQSTLARPMVGAMRYDEMRDHVRDHFGQLLRKFRERTARNGPVDELGLESLSNSLGLSEGDPADWATLLYADGQDGLLRWFCEARGIVPEPEGRERDRVAAELQKG